jgi:hypothetical protein
MPMTAIRSEVPDGTTHDVKDLYCIRRSRRCRTRTLQLTRPSVAALLRGLAAERQSLGGRVHATKHAISDAVEPDVCVRHQEDLVVGQLRDAEAAGLPEAATRRLPTSTCSG